MTPNQSHVAGLELALSKVDPWSDRAVWLRDLIDQAKSAPPSPDAELVAELREIKSMFEFVEGRAWLRSDAAVYVYEKLRALLEVKP